MCISELTGPNFNMRPMIIKLEQSEYKTTKQRYTPNN